jgi:GT2 family glycosyltransferase
MSNEPALSVVLGAYNRKPFLKATMESLRREIDGLAAEMIVVDGGSTDGSLRWLARQKDILTIVQHNRGLWRGRPIARRSWGYFMNLAFKCAQGKYILMVSDDCLLVPGAVRAGLQLFEERLAKGDRLGAVAFYWRNWPEQKEYWVGLTFERMFVNHGLFLRSALSHIGWIDEDSFFFYHADSDLALRLWDAGYQVIDCPGAFVEHFTHATVAVRETNLERQQKDWGAYLARWRQVYKTEADGRWLTRAYDDPERTYRRFPRLQVGRSRLNQEIARLAGFLARVRSRLA